MRTRTWISIAGALFFSCATEPDLIPMAGVQQVEGEDYSAVGHAGGVTIVVDGNAWEGEPQNLDVVVPALVTIRNNSTRHVRISYDQFRLVQLSGTPLRALPPLQIRGTEFVSTPVELGFWQSGFFVASPYRGYYPSIGTWDGPFVESPLYCDSYYSRWPISLPTEDMVRAALPEGVLAPQGRVTGFMYFQDAAAGTRVRFRGTLIDARTQQPFGTIELPFMIAN